MASINLFQVHGLPQLFIQLGDKGNISLAISKVVDDFLIIWLRKKIEDFHATMW